jgi:hypothetical protein
LAGSPVTPFVDALAWLWRLGPRRDSPAPTAVGVGAAADAVELDALIRARQLSGAVILVAGARAEDGPVPARYIGSGVAQIRGVRIEGVHTLFAEGSAVVRSSLGTHAVRRGNLLALGADSALWGRLDSFWALETVASFLVERLERPLVLLPPVGCLRLDDFPGTAELQLGGVARGDRRQRRRAETLIGRLESARARLIVAVAARALDGDVEVPLDRVWPDAVAALADGVERGVFEPACHGLLHLNPHARAEGRVDPREFAGLDEGEAGLRLDAACAWLRTHVGAPRSFVAPAWGYGPGVLAAAAARRLPTWLPPAPGPLLDGFTLRETLAVGLPGLHRIDYAPLRRLAALGLPPIVVFHGQLVDDRLPRLRATRDLATAGLLTLLPDLPRIARLSGVRWVGVAELLELFRAHGSIEVTGSEVQQPTVGSPRFFQG